MLKLRHSVALVTVNEGQGQYLAPDSLVQVQELHHFPVSPLPIKQNQEKIVTGQPQRRGCQFSPGVSSMESSWELQPDLSGKPAWSAWDWERLGAPRELSRNVGHS